MEKIVSEMGPWFIKSLLAKEAPEHHKPSVAIFITMTS